MNNSLKPRERNLEREPIGEVISLKGRLGVQVMHYAHFTLYAALLNNLNHMMSKTPRATVLLLSHHYNDKKSNCLAWLFYNFCSRSTKMADIIYQIIETLQY